MLYETKALSKLTAEERRVCDRLNMRDRGAMQFEFRYHMHRQPNDTFAVLAKDAGRIVGWALVFPKRYDVPPDAKSGRYLAYYYVRKEARRQGIGSQLLKHSRKIDRRPVVEPWNTQSAGFFKKFKAQVKAESWNAVWLRD